MVQVSVEVSSGAARFRVAVRAESIQRATDLVATRYPGRVCRLTLPIDPELFFLNNAAAGVEAVDLEQPNVLAA